MMKIRCITLFDITKTNISNRRKLLDHNSDPNLDKERNQQSNFETILQVISMRSQPEDITDPVKKTAEKPVWGSKIKIKQSMFWQFEFSVSQSAVFTDNGNVLGKLISDCEGVPMISNLDEMKNLGRTLSTTTEYRNIHFEVIDE